ncbi:MgtC/SapB family protein [Mucilaginibacter rubeus]|uniref:MgtC/SapB family protein n=1 Tax=Mucilaginibacter rubeus TaxID=2027860 RepID=A0AAE6JNF9_9SPHI|nr:MULTISPECIES: MgtC/SapB family protein [Mucilaginibacter]QEM07832.1 MgtC/SapB family protein [Mucilaginibacter rubeus]QEM20284.1 MgtC/SapB family protein [Mucilaginibacter gossypii]QTE42998.1 MgtC/SapB family protein [Mucilaginibacter rubeus]QTE49599.1 MgtC/SapB family protein [Mucilaginibacter rubeus]QTE54694.1 MgtC/SapB family protein [Mucilaginibacter rubeus]
MTYQNELIVLLKIIIAAILGAAIGYDREKHGRDAGIRTYSAVCVGAAIFTSLAAHLGDTAAISRVVANIVVGIGFLGAGIISRDNGGRNSNGLTTSATVWCTAAVGVTIGLNEYIIAAGTTAVLYFILALHHQPWYVKWKKSIHHDGNE